MLSAPTPLSPNSIPLGLQEDLAGSFWCSDIFNTRLQGSSESKGVSPGKIWEEEMVRRKKEIDMKTWVQYILHLIVQIPELNWGFSQKVDLGLVCFTQIWLGLNSAFKIIKLHGNITCSWSLTLQLWFPLFWGDGRLIGREARLLGVWDQFL